MPTKQQRHQRRAHPRQDREDDEPAHREGRIADQHVDQAVGDGAPLLDDRRPPVH